MKLISRGKFILCIMLTCVAMISIASQGFAKIVTVNVGETKQFVVDPSEVGKKVRFSLENENTNPASKIALFLDVSNQNNNEAYLLYCHALKNGRSIKNEYTAVLGDVYELSLGCVSAADIKIEMSPNNCKGYATITIE